MRELISNNLIKAGFIPNAAFAAMINVIEKAAKSEVGDIVYSYAPYVGETEALNTEVVSSVTLQEMEVMFNYLGMLKFFEVNRTDSNIILAEVMTSIEDAMAGPEYDVVPEDHDW